MITEHVKRFGDRLSNGCVVGMFCKSEDPGVDVIFIGPYDLSQSLGVAGQVDHPDVEKKMNQIVDLCASRGVAVGTFVDTPENAAKWRARGVRYLSYSVDVGLVAEKAAEVRCAVIGT